LNAGALGGRSATTPNEPRLGAFCAHADVRIDAPPGGPLSGRTFAVKDVFAIAGVAACYGNPTFLRAHPPATRTAATVAALVAAGATVVGVTITDELALSLTGENHHYGTPRNVACPDRVPGGSSSGSAAAVAGHLVDFALGTDTGGSVRVPASHTGVFGVRPTWGAVSEDGVLPLAPRFDTVGWFANDPATLAAVGAVVLPPPRTDAPIALRFVAPRGVEALLDADAAKAFANVSAALAEALEGPLVRESIGEDFPSPPGWAGTYLTLQNAEIARLHRAFVEGEHPAFGSLIAGRIARAMQVDAAAVEVAEARRARMVAALHDVLDAGAWLVLPSAPGAAPKRGSSDEAIDAFTYRGLALAAPASLAGLPQISLPLGTSDGCPLGVSLVGRPGDDLALLRAASLAWAKLRPRPASSARPLAGSRISSR
jgi:amidase